MTFGPFCPSHRRFHSQGLIIHALIDSQTETVQQDFSASISDAVPPCYTRVNSVNRVVSFGNVRACTCDRLLIDEFRMLWLPWEKHRKVWQKMAVWTVTSAGWPSKRPFCAILFYVFPCVTKACQTCLSTLIKLRTPPLALRPPAALKSQCMVDGDSVRKALAKP